MSTATMTTKGQMTIPVDIREQFHMEAGTTCLIVPIDQDRFEVYPKTVSLESISGRFRHAGATVSLADMDDAITEALAEKHVPPTGSTHS